MTDIETAAYGTTDPRLAPLDPGIRIRLSVMMFLQYAIWGAWWSVLGKYMVSMSMGGVEIGRAFATTAVASIISPLVFGQIADRWVPTQYLLAGLHLLGAGALYLVTRFSDFWSFYTCVLIWAIVYIPTISLTNSLSFHQLPDVGRLFPGIRVFGTIGWIVVGLFVGRMLNEESTQPIHLAAGLSFVMGLYCFALPHTPPTGKAGDTWPPLRAIGMLRHGQFALFIFVSFLIATLLAAYFAFTAQYLGAPPRSLASAADWMTLGQFAEMLLLPLLPIFLRVIGMKWTLIMGIAAWGVRYTVFALGQPTWLVLGSLALHGVCYDFFFVAAYIYVDREAHPEIRASAQALFNFVVMGVGMLIGNEVFGRLVTHYTTEATKVTDWTTVWTYPAVAVVVPVLLLLICFRTGKANDAPAPAA